MGDMDHSEVRELLEDAAIEPNGLERLMAGDTPAAALVASHLAGCPDCAAELQRLHRAVGLIRPAVGSVPPPELRERTLAYVAALGRPRGTAAATPGPAPAVGPASGAGPAPVVFRAPAVGAPAGVATPPTSLDAARARRPIARLGVLAGLAAALVIAVTGTALIVSADRNRTITVQAAEIEALGDVARSTLRVDAEPDARRIVLAGTTSGASGQIAFSPTSTEVVVVADGLAPAPAGKEYRCWVEVAGKRAPIGKMFFGGSLAYWVGDVPALKGVPADARFGVTLVDLAGGGGPGQDILVSGA